MATTEPPATVFVLSAQPIDENGVIGFGDRNPLTAETDTLASVFHQIAELVADTGQPRNGDAWYLTLEIRAART
jgi:hypothetical protein